MVNRCFLCKEEEESIDHIILHCSKARVLWDLLFAIFGIHWIQPPTIKEALIRWSGLLWIKDARKFGKRLLCIFFGLFGRK